ncbi:radical SAM protein [Bacteroides fragilis]|jgi:radical SAM superfamily enzyme YgiQ (UPF0313 family)|nr:radical SAM protein [Bacteroides fragilis]
MKKIILNWMPPSMVEMPSPAMSVLKQYLTQNGYHVDIIYWNIKLLPLQREFVWWPNPTMLECEIYAELLFNNYLAIKKKDPISYAKIKSMLIALKPQYLDADSCFFDRHMETYAHKLEQLIDQELDSLDFSNILYFGMSVNLYQWICATIIAKKIKTINSHIPIVIGGIGTKESAVSFLRNFKQFDIALWGEGENNLLQLTRYLNNRHYETNTISNIPNTAYSAGESIQVSTTINHTFIELSSRDIQPDFTDYFEQISILKENSSIDNIQTFLFIEGSRSCHWKKCQFCYLNTGYKHRLKDIKTIEYQLRSMINKYGIFEFSFLDNDVIGNDWERFSSLLDILISIKEDFPEFKITLAEIITKDIQASYIKRMALAGFRHVQIGYESASNSLLKKIHKKNTFASNLLFIKFACKYDILVGGANIIRGLPEETYEDILESIENLRSLRFFYRQGIFKHTMSNLGIMNSSRYYKTSKDDLSNFRQIEPVDLLPDEYIKSEDLHQCTIAEKIHCNEKSTWEHFSIVENHYLKSRYEYKIYAKQNSIIYKEKLNGETFNELEIDYSSLEYMILKKSNQSVLTFECLKKTISGSEYKNITDCELYNTIENLKKEGLIYTPNDYSEIISIADIDDFI